MKAVMAFLVLALAVSIGTAGPSVGDSETQLSLPLTLEKVWHRTGGKKYLGDLIVAEDAMEFISKKRTVSLPMDWIHMVSLGKMRGDVDTDWVVMSVGAAPPYDIVGFKDGRKMGFGRSTGEIFDTLFAVVRKLSAAQFKAPPGYKAHGAPASECTVAVPENWNAYIESTVFMGDRSVWGTHILSAEPIRRVEEGPEGPQTVQDRVLLERVLAGEEPAFFIERSAAGRGMACGGFSKGATKRVVQRALDDPVLGGDNRIVDGPSEFPAPVGGCEGLRVMARSRRADGEEMVLELFAVARRETLYIFGLRALAERYEDFREPFDAAVESVKLSVAR